MITDSQKAQPKALLFDVFGTVVDWRKTVTETLKSRSIETLNSASCSIPTAVRIKSAEVDWPAFAQEWRSSYYKFTHDQARRKFNDEPLDFKTVDDHHLDSLHVLLDQYGISTLWTDDQVIQVSRIWHYLEGWPDSSPGLTALKAQGFIICTLSNGNSELLTDMASHAELPWTHVYSAEMFGAYKPHPSMYISASKALGLEPSQCAMVAAHLSDLEAAKACGLQTIYIDRAEEETWPVEKVGGAKREGWVDVWVGISDDSAGGGILEVARKLEGEKKV